MAVPAMRGALALTAVAVVALARHRAKQRKCGKDVDTLSSTGLGACGAPLVHAFAASPVPCSSSGGAAVQLTPPPSVPALPRGTLFALTAAASLMLGVAASLARDADSGLPVAAAFAVGSALVVLATVLALVLAAGRAAAELAIPSDATVHVVDGAEPIKPPPDLSGVWIKDSAASSSMEAAMQLMHLNGIVRTAVRLIKGMSIELQLPDVGAGGGAGSFSFGVFSIIGWFKITERYSLDGTPSGLRRRDLRRGAGCTLRHALQCPLWVGMIIGMRAAARHVAPGVSVRVSLDKGAEGRAALIVCTPP